MAKLGWIGLGDIGLPMAKRLADAGHELHVYARRAASLDPLRASNVTAAPSPAALAEVCEAVLICVTDTKAVEEVAFGKDGIASAARAGTLLVDHSTIHPQRSRDFAARLAETGMGWVEAPVSGGRVGAEQGTLAIFAAGNAAEIERARPWMETYATNITHVGGHGAGDVAKMCNQAVLCVTLAVWAEALNYAERCGADVPKVYQALAGSWSDSKVRQVLVPHMISGHYPPGGPASLMLKDLDILGDMASQTKSAMPMASMVTQLFRQQVAMGYNDSGIPGVMQIYRDGPWRPKD